jgi:hypothetical protein
MKLLTTLLFTVLISKTYSQEKLLDILPLKDGIVTYSEVVQVDSTTKSSLYKKAKRWFITTYKSAKDVVQLDDQESGEITGKGSFKISYYTREPNISHTISVYVKDGRYKYLITQLSYSDNQNEKFSIENFPNSWGGKKKLYLKVDEEIMSIISSLKKYMSAPDKDDW